MIIEITDDEANLIEWLIDNHTFILDPNDPDSQLCDSILDSLGQ